MARHLASDRQGSIQTTRMTKSEIDTFASRALEQWGYSLPVRQTSLRQTLSMPAMLVEHFHALVALPGKAWAVYMVLRLRSRLERSPTVSLTTTRLQYYGISRQEKRTALRHLETAGLITVAQRLRKNPLITLL